MSKPVHHGRTTDNGKAPPAPAGPPLEVITHLVDAYHRLPGDVSERPAQFIHALLESLEQGDRLFAETEGTPIAPGEAPWTEEDFWRLVKSCGFQTADERTLAVPPADAVKPRTCDLNKCTEHGTRAVGISVAAYTGRAGDELTLVICEPHGDQLQAGFIAGFAWTPVYKHEVPVAPTPTEPAAAPQGQQEPPTVDAEQIAREWPQRVDEYGAGLPERQAEAKALDEAVKRTTLEAGDAGD